MKKYFDKLYKEGKDKFYQILKEHLKENKRMFIVTANPETIMTALDDDKFNDLLIDKNTTIVPDGIGICKGAKILKYDVKERIAGIDIMEYLLHEGNLQHKKIYLLGSKEEVLTSLVSTIKKEYPYLEIVGYQNGYIKDKDKVLNDAAKLEPDIVLVALGIPNQEKLLYKHLNEFKKGILVGVGGSFDVISGYKKRAPKLFIKLNLEWLYRIVKEPSRIKRFYNNNIKFIFKIKRNRKK